jgi:hypothetical protein
MELTKEQVGEAFRTIMLEENYNFLEDDLVNLANVFVAKAEPFIRADELAKCVEVVTALNRVVGDKLQEVRSVVN